MEEAWRGMGKAWRMDGLELVAWGRCGREGTARSGVWDGRGRRRGGDGREFGRIHEI
jgi:hypothetical protein